MDVGEEKVEVERDRSREKMGRTGRDGLGWEDMVVRGSDERVCWYWWVFLTVILCRVSQCLVELKAEMKQK